MGYMLEMSYNGIHFGFPTDIKKKHIFPIRSYMYFKLCSAVVAPVFDFQLTNKKIKFLWVQIKEHSHKEQFHHIFGF